MLKSRTWFTENTEVLTIRGWVSIMKLSKISKVVVKKKDNRLKGENLLEYNTATLKDSKVLYYNSNDVFIQAKNIILPEKGIWRVDTYIDSPAKFKKIKYTGKIYNLVTPSNNLITRNTQIFNTNNNDYILSLCQSVE